MCEKPKIIRVGSRKSELALIQTKHVISCLQKLYPKEKFEIHTMTTVGDRVLNISLPKIGEKALFTKDLEDALSNGTVDFVVHSLKDLPTSLPMGMTIGAVLEREDPRDALVLNEKYKGKSLATLPDGSVIGTSSLRRTAQIARSFPHLKVHDIRGNLNTRLAKLDAPNSIFAGILLAKAGLMRMGWEKRINQTLEPDDLMYAVGQGALAVECRANDKRILEMLQEINCVLTQCRILTERSFLKTLGGGCSAPIAVNTILKHSLSSLNNDNNDNVNCEISITGAVWSLDGKIEIQGATNSTFNLNNTHVECDYEAPNKRRKVDNLMSTKSKNETPKPNISPPIIDESATTSGTTSVGAFINIHEDLFKKCPHLILKDDKKEILKIDVADKCPLNMAVGQDVMGQCPYFVTDEKVKIPEKCTSDVKKTTESIGKSCPFLDSNKNDSIKVTTKDSKCPIISTIDIKKSVNSSEEESAIIDNVLMDNILYCGLFRHKTINVEVYEKCEALGKNLANSLIESGALQVMETAQKEIRKNLS